MVGEGQGQSRGPDETPGPAATAVPRRVHFLRVGLDADIAPAGVGERGREVAGATAHVDKGAAGPDAPEVVHHGGGIGGQCAIETGRVGLFVAEFAEQPDRPGQGRTLGEQVGDGHDGQPCQIWWC